MTDFSPLHALLTAGNNPAALFGVTVGIVTNNKDPQKLGRVCVRLPWLSDVDETLWARVLTPMAGKERGIFFLPEVEDEVLVAFEQGQAEFPYVLGALWNGQDTPPETNNNGENNKRLIKSRSGHIIRFDDTESHEKIEIIDKSGKNSIVIDTENNNITIKADGDIEIGSTNGKVIISGQGIELSSKAEVKIEAKSKLDIKSDGPMKLQGATIDLN